MLNPHRALASLEPAQGSISPTGRWAFQEHSCIPPPCALLWVHPLSSPPPATLLVVVGLFVVAAAAGLFAAAAAGLYPNVDGPVNALPPLLP